MNIAFVGTGKLGGPIATALAWRGHNVTAIDPASKCLDKTLPEDGYNGRTWATIVNEVIDSKRLQIANGPSGHIDDADVVFVCVQTPHEPRFEGVTALPPDRANFDYSYLIDAVRQIVRAASKPVLINVVSTVLPGTMREHIIPLLRPDDALVYNPSFCAMGSVVRDYLEPEFVLLGSDYPVDATTVLDVYKQAGVNAWPQQVSVESAELAKVAYNTMISLKLAAANVFGEICDKIAGADADEVSGVLQAATRRVSSGAYLVPGMGDGGACHPRDNIAMSYLARRLGVHFDIFDAAMRARETHARQLAVLLHRLSETNDLPIYIIGINYKPGSPLTDGAHGRLVFNILYYDMGLGDRVLPDNVGGSEFAAFQTTVDASGPGVFLIASPESWMAEVEFKPDSVVIDPWRIIEDQRGVEVIRLGERERGALRLPEAT